jgi:hypothetical protein
VVPPEAVNVTVSPGNNVVEPLALIVALIAADSFTLVGDDIFVHPKLLVTLTVYDPEFTALIDWVVAPPGDHK